MVSLDPDRPLSAEQAAEYLHLTTRSLRRMRAEGRGPRAVKLGGRLLFRRADLQSWLDANADREPRRGRPRRAS